MVSIFKEKKEEFLKKYEDLKEKFDILYDAFNELEFNSDPTVPLMTRATKFIGIAKEMSRLKAKVSFYSKAIKDYLKKQEAILYMKTKIDAENNSKKTTEGYLESIINQDENLYEIKLLKSEFETIETLIEDELQLIIETIQLFKKIADIKSIIAVKLQENFEYGN